MSDPCCSYCGLVIPDIEPDVRLNDKAHDSIMRFHSSCGRRFGALLTIRSEEVETKINNAINRAIAESGRA